MAIRQLTYALAAAGMAFGTTAHAADVPARGSTSIDGAEQLTGSPGLLAVIVGIAAILAILAFEGNDDEDLPTSP